MKAKRNIVYKGGVLKFFHPRMDKKIVIHLIVAAVSQMRSFKKLNFLTKRLKDYKPDNNTLSNYP